MPLTDAVLLSKAYHLAAQWHTTQKRKGGAAEPYINHLVEVAALVSAATGGRDHNLSAAAVLHDTIEDAGISYETLVKEFNHDVADLVREVTDDKGLDKNVRKELQIRKTPAKSMRAKIITLADKTSNLRSILNSPPDWPLERKQEYLAWARAVVDGTRGANTWLEGVFGAAAGELELALDREQAKAADETTSSASQKMIL